MTRRPAHGATRRPPMERPGNGFGRSLRPGPAAVLRGEDAYLMARVLDPSELLHVVLREDVVVADDALHA